MVWILCGVKLHSGAFSFFLFRSPQSLVPIPQSLALKECTLKLVISSDHAGFPLKEEVRANLAKAGHEVMDLGTYKSVAMLDVGEQAAGVDFWKMAPRQP